MIPQSPAPSTQKVLNALEKQSKNKILDHEDELILQYYRRHRKDAKFMQKLDDAREIIAARQRSAPYQPLMPIMSSNCNQFQSPNNRHVYDRQRHVSPSVLSTPHRSRSSIQQRVYGHQRHTSPSIFSGRKRRRSPSPNTLSDGNQSSPDMFNTGVLHTETSINLSVNLFDHEPYQSAKDESYHTTMSSSPAVEKSRHHAREQRSPTPINDDHFVNDDCDWNLNSHASENNNAIAATLTPSVSANNSQSEQTNEPVPFIMGTLKNTDNSCYMNSLLYILRMTPTFVHSIHHLLENMIYLSVEYDNDLEMIVAPHECLQLGATSVMISNKEKWPNDLYINEPQKEVIKQLHRIFLKLTAREKREDNEPIEKKKFQAAIRKIAPYFTERRQEDAHEFLLIILNCIRDCGAFLMELIDEHASMFENIIDPASRLSFDLIEKNFIGKELTTTKCVCCETTSDRTDDVMYFYIPLPEKKEYGKDFIQESCLTRENLSKIKCEQCQHSQESIQSKSYPQLPRILIFQLGRFDNRLNKIHTITPTPLELDCFCTSCTENRQSDECIDHKYRLYGVIIHLGTTLRSGHYTAYARTFNDGEQQPQQQDVEHQCESIDCCHLKFQQIDIEACPELANGFWYNCNDELIEVISETDFQAQINRKNSYYTPYILFYVRNDHLANY